MASNLRPRRAVLNAFLREDLSSFIARSFGVVAPGIDYHTNWHIDLLADRLTDVWEGRTKRLIINLPPRSLKSTAVSVAFVAWMLGHTPTSRIICASYGADLALKLARDCRRIMGSDWYSQAFPRTRMNPLKTAEGDFETTAGGYRLSSSLGGTLTGRGGMCLIVDDPIKPTDALSPVKRKAVIEWFTGTLLSRLDDKTDGAVIVVMQRVHVDDLTGYLLEKAGWTLLSLPAIATEDEAFTLADGRIVGRRVGEPLDPRRESLEVLDRVRADMGSYHFEAQYQQAPVPERGNLIHMDWFQTYDTVPTGTAYDDSIVQSWDTAMTAHDGSDWSVGMTWAVRGTDYYLIDVHRERADFPTMKRRVVELKARFKADTVLIEEAGSGQALIQQLRSDTDVRPIAIRPVGSKAERMGAQTTYIEAGRVKLPTTAPWLDDLRSELAAFPFGRHDDQVDSVSQFLGWVTTRVQIPSVAPFSVPREDDYSW
ncbi:hypothetical protein BAL199_14577 [alpha proteobacterium BAL199]|nr:hypothetical protein BAL199_00065 [alpha proteobacterium BAL199]EDP61085.1 hypothetical protein BAL199_30625 [alpha proteobacterium BAL199]EDP63869.1 hypothetical protein BAL199_14577 [alpha proteobacterium BAL199]